MGIGVARLLSGWVCICILPDLLPEKIIMHLGYLFFNSLSDWAEYLVAVATLGMIVLPIYLHFVEYAPFWQQTHTHHDSWLHLMILHLLPSLWINSYEAYKAADPIPKSV